MAWGDYWGGYWDDKAVDPATYRGLLQQLLPLGHAWTRDPDATLTTLLEALGVEFVRVDLRADDIVEEADVRTAVQLLDNWEELAILPGSGVTTPTTTADRQAALHAQLTKRLSSSHASIIQIAERLGYTSVSIREDGDAFRVGYSAVGDALQQGYWIHHFTVIATRPASLADDTQLTYLVDDAKPAHTTFGLEIT
jgi:uncharacterized protein YmfQ (DUF2313 family)